jgi:hypothetical protein
LILYSVFEPARGLAVVGYGSVVVAGAAGGSFAGFGRFVVGAFEPFGLLGEVAAVGLVADRLVDETFVIFGVVDQVGDGGVAVGSACRGVEPGDDLLLLGEVVADASGQVGVVDGFA